MATVAAMARLELQDLVDRAGYCVRLMRLARHLADNLADDHERRIVGRLVLVFLPLYVEEAFTFLRRGALLDEIRLPLRDEVKKLRSDFDEFYKRIRHDLAAHRDDVPLDVALEAWNEIDDGTLAWFVDAAEASFANIVRAHPLLAGELKPFAAEHDGELIRLLRAPVDRDRGARFSTDALALSRGEISMIPMHPVQARVSVLISIIDTMSICGRLSGLIGNDIGCHVLLKTLFIMDSINLIDGIYGEVAGGAAVRSPGLLEIMERDTFAGAPVLRGSVSKLDLDAAGALRFVRNKACAHLDPTFSLREITSNVIELDNDVIVTRAAAPAWAAVEDACAADITTKWLLMSGVSLSGLNPASTPGVRAYRAAERAETR